MSSRRGKAGVQVKTAIMSAGLIFTGLYECFEFIEEGDNLLEAAGKAVRRTKARGDVIKRASREVNVMEKGRPRR